MDCTQPISTNPKDQITKQYLNTVAENKPAKLVFRKGDQLGANAVALPNNTIIITDELIKLAHTNQEILGVLAHEQGHLVYRHSLQQGLTSLGLSILYIAMTGDNSDLFTSLPAAMIGANYSRKFESEADLYALQLMDKKHIEVSHFANFLQRLSDTTEEGIDKRIRPTHQLLRKNLQLINYLQLFLMLYPLILQPKSVFEWFMILRKTERRTK